MGRKPNPQSIIEQSAELPEKEHALVQRAVAVGFESAGRYTDERDLFNQLLGQAQMADGLAQFSRTVRTSKLAFVKENKLYRALKGRKIPHGAEFSGTWDEFCQLVGGSVDQIDRDIENLRTFGEQAMDALSSMGVGYRELRQYRRLPEDSKNALIEVAKTGDKDALLELAEDLLEKQSAEKAKLAKDLEGAKADAEIARAETAKRDDKVRKAEYAQAKAERIWTQTTPDDRDKFLLSEIDRGIRVVRDALGLDSNRKDAGLRGAMLRLQAQTKERGDDASQLLSDKIVELLNSVRSVRGSDGLDLQPQNDLGADPEWLKQR